jgi:hypothetical protein
VWDSRSEVSTMYRRLLLDPDHAAAYLRRQLSNGNSLCRRLQSIDLSEGTLEAFVPASVPEASPHDLHEFERSFHFPDGVDRNGPGPLAAIVHELRRVTNPENCTIVGEAFSSRPTAVFLQNLPIRVALFGEEVYFLSSPLDDQRSIEIAIRRASSIWRSTTVLVKTPMAKSAAGPVNWQQDDLYKLANAVIALAVGAYDDEGYVLWTCTGV